MTKYAYGLEVSEDAEAALRWGLKHVPPREEDTVYCVTVLEPPVRLTAGGTTIVDFSTHSPEDVRRIEAVGEGLLSRYVAIANELGVQKVQSVVIVPPPDAPRLAAPNLAAWSEKNGIDLIVVGRHGQSAVARGLRAMVGMGSQTTYLVQHASVAVLAVPPVAGPARAEVGLNVPRVVEAMHQQLAAMGLAMNPSPAAAQKEPGAKAGEGREGDRDAAAAAAPAGEPPAAGSTVPVTTAEPQGAAAGPRPRSTAAAPAF